ncbi:MAG: DUF4335 domain-containing protein [Kaiparowitsia implicata GSE-PSE-MK54-09C]|jgi:hypothetical protein|nr:DUF4335 domain-containing protein [Kaiparowitsia implicata GSE-PSE-MK54-09C]
MTLQREYSLPNCKLVVAGLAEEKQSPVTSSMANTGRPPLSIVTQVECHLAGMESPIIGGRELLENLSNTVSQYAQEILSGIPHTQPGSASGANATSVKIERLTADKHRLTVMPTAANGNGSQPSEASAQPIQVDLPTVYLFDLVEAVDQFLTDRQTLPSLTLNPTSVSRRYARTHEPMSKRAVPAAVGFIGLVAAGAALFFLPVPEPRPEPAAENATPDSVPDSVQPTTPPAAPPVDGDSSDAGDGAGAVQSGAIAPTGSTDSADAAGDSSDDSTNNSDAIETTTGTAAIPLDQLLDSAPPITDLDQLNQLKFDLRDQLSDAWDRGNISYDESLVYRVAVAGDGDILGFRYSNDAALTYANETPLPDLRYTPAGSPPPESIAEFRVVFTPSGVIEVSPWHGIPTE